MNTKTFWGSGVFSVLLAAVVIYWFTLPSYGKISPPAYRCATALYGACMAKNLERLDKVQAIIEAGADKLGAVGTSGRVVAGSQASSASTTPVAAVTGNGNAELSAKEKKWLTSIIEVARAGHWKSAAWSAKQMMLDQVDY